MFTDKDFEILKTIHCLKASGMQTEEIMELIRPVLPEDESIDALLRIPRKRRLAVEKQTAELPQASDAVSSNADTARPRNAEKQIKAYRISEKNKR
ncbi:MAG: hypothetical protein SO533_02060 [Eubacteriales bacterium]|nr:hypothetical protein [Eubacteriales bacterium]